jgi:16S rRNA (guanine1207-N2)-methyltransferase
MAVPQYFDDAEGLGHRDIDVEFTLFGERYHLKSDKGIFSKDSLDDGTRLLLETIAQADLGRTILDLGCGAGPIGLILAHLDPKRSLTLSDVNPRALAVAAQNAESLGLAGSVRIVQSDVYRSIDSTFDAIVTNPPIRAGKKITYAMYDGAPAHLNPGGSLYLVIRKQQGAASAFAHLATLFPQVGIVAKRKGYRVIRATKQGAAINA